MAAASRRPQCESLPHHYAIARPGHAPALGEHLIEEAARRAREKEVALINRRDDEFNSEMADVPTDQAEP